MLLEFLRLDRESNNWNESTHPAMTAAPTTNGAHRLTSEVRTGTHPYSKTYVLDGVGNRLSQTVGGVTTTFSYSNDDELLSTSGGIVNSYGYNANGEQTSRTAGGVTTQFLTDPVFGRTWLEAQGAQTTAVYTYGNALVRKDGEYPLFDGLGSERTVTNASQTVTGTIHYDAFGQTVGTTGSSTNPYMFAATSGYGNGLLSVVTNVNFVS